MRTSLAGACALVLAAALGGERAHSQETGIAEIHSWVKVGRKTCMLDHFHDGSGRARTRANAQRAAIISWSEFTAWEYGTPWGRYAIAASKKMECERIPEGWRCAVQARPCRPY
jgi:hypothetical protein